MALPDPHAAAEALRAAQRALENEVARLPDMPTDLAGCLAATRQARQALHEALSWKECMCCHQRYSPEAFKALPEPRNGGRKVYEDEGIRYIETYRNCSCGSTMLRIEESPC